MAANNKKLKRHYFGSLLVTLMTLCASLLVPLPAYAVLDLELTQGIEAALPVSITDFQGQVNSNDAITTVISNDLKMSGRFRLMPVIDSKDSNDFKSWSAHGVDYIVTGRVEAADNNKLRVTYQLLQSAGQKNELLNREFFISKAQSRKLAHQISDEIYHELTGDKGVFSTRIAYISILNRQTMHPNYRLEVSDIDGHNQQTLLSSPAPIMSPAWSPDAKSIAYVSFEDDRAQIFRVTLATGQRQLLTRFSGINGAPAWSPDLKQMAVVLSKSGQPKIYLLDLINHKVQKVTDGNSIDTEPAFSPDGQSLLFTSNRGGGPQIYKLNINNNSIARVTYSGSYNASASYSKDGRSIVLLHREGASYNIALQDVATGQLVNLTQSGQEESPSFSPNGKLILFATRTGERGLLSIVSIDGKVQIRLPSSEGDVQEPAWSPYIA